MQAVLIYIPLCIYFNWFSPSENRLYVFSFTFHYVSISTILTIRILVVIRIYIPLCIYFNMHKLIIYFLRSFIYIPLCIYFNLIRLYILILHYNLHSTMYLFQPCAITGTTLLPIHLHSTMYLFQRLVKQWMFNLYKIYIPLCIYFNWVERIYCSVCW